MKNILLATYRWI